MVTIDIRILRRIALRAALLLLAVIPAACAQVDDLAPADGADEVVIRATVGGSSAVADAEDVETRANNSVYDVTSQLYNLDFFVRVAGQNREDEFRAESSRYLIPSGYSGMLYPASEQKTLNWFARDRKHEFYGWTMPFVGNTAEFDPGEDVLADGIEFSFQDTDLSNTTNANASAWDASSWQNGQKLEKFIGGKTDELTYLENGKYVNLRMRHLVSKIMVKEIAVIDNTTGVFDKAVKGTITFYGMPKDMVFYPVPVDDEGRRLQPYVKIPDNWDFPQDKSLTFALTNSSKTYNWEGHTGTSSTYSYVDAWYIPPEMDFDLLTYKIQLYKYVDGEWIPDPTHGEHGAYFGSFKTVKFTRTTNGSNYDDPDNPGSDDTILHAGEYLVLYINMMERGNPSIHGTIVDWTNKTNREGYSHVEDGMYAYEEFYDMQTAMGTSSSAETKEEFFMLHGSGRDTGMDPEGEYPEYENIPKYKGKELKIFEVYEDIGYNGYGNSTTGSSAKCSSIVMPEGYILDGKGHTINMTGNNPSIGNVRDIYLRSYLQNTSTNPYTYTEYIVYIDKMGDVWTVDPVTFEETKTSYNINNVNKNPVNIDLTTGRVY